MNDYDPNYIPVKNYYLVGQKCILYNAEDKFLLLKRSTKGGGGGWSVPGGGLDQDEDPVQGIKREVTEEAGLEIYEVEPIKLITFKENEDSVIMIAYRARTDSDKVTLNWEHDDFKWVSKDEALNEKMSDVLKDFIKLT